MNKCPVRDAIHAKTADKKMPPNHKTAYDRFVESKGGMPKPVTAIMQGPVGTGEHTSQPVVPVTAVVPVLQDENHDVPVPVWPVLQKPEDASARYFHSRFC